MKKAPTSVALREMLVDLAVTGNDAPQAEQDLRDLIKMAPDEPQYRFRLAMLYSRTKQLDDAQRVLEDATKAFPKGTMQNSRWSTFSTCSARTTSPRKPSVGSSHSHPMTTSFAWPSVPC